ncbi:PepSY domain-containing protein [Anaerotignum lactatifermentans]|uniref:PepSY domain-containing protein n=1 Tax=Anaerotignum lactatifermentans TaxID=160404 RepID=UPI00307BBA79
MKYLGRLTVMAAAAWMMTGCVQQTKQAEYLGVDAAKAIALAAADITESDAVFTTAELEEKNGLSYYEIDFTVGGQEYDYDIDAISGKIIENQTKAVDDTAANEATTANTINAASDGQVTLEEAKEIALNHAGLSADGVTFIKGKLERDDGREKYDIEFYTSDFKEYDYEIDPQTGEILSYDYDAEDYAPQKSSTGNSSAITEAKAKEIAVAQVSGATVDDIREWEADYDDGRLEYEGKIYDADTEYEFTIDGYSGSIISWETEPLRR